MRNYIILNDVNSNTINGLLIQELPPISKPKMRTQIEEIDGRAGDIVTQLGYAAYTKTISVGLYGDFDINEVISYFNSSGTVVFSNEPDKYYNYEIIDQIDFNRLVRFRTAKVKMHVQPFKYPIEEEPLVAQYQLVTNTGSDMSLDNTANALFRKLDLKGNTSQTGTPTPDSPIPINVVSGDNSINVCGKNLFQPTTNDITFEAGTNTTQWVGSLKLEANKKYYLSYNLYETATTSTRNTLRLLLDGTSTNYYQAGDTNYNTTTGIKVWEFTPTITGTYNIGYWVHTANVNVKVKDFMISLSSDTTYEPYIGNTYPIYLGVENLDTNGTAYNKTANSSGVVQDANEPSKYLSMNDYVRVEPNTTYSVVFENEVGGNLFISTKNADGTFIARTNLSSVRTFTTDSNTYYVFLYIYKSSGDYENVGGYVRLTKGSTPQHISTTPIELCEIGDYKDAPFKAVNGDETYDSLTDAQKEGLTIGNWYVYKAIGKETYDGSSDENWQTSGTNPFFYIKLQNDAVYKASVPQYNLCNYFNNASISSTNSVIGYWVLDNSYIRIRPDNTTTSVAAFKTWLSTHNTIVYYALQTPTITEITDEDLIAQLEALKQANSYDGQTNISHEYNGSPFILDVAAVQKGTDTLVVNNEGNIYARPTLDIEGTGMVNVYLEGNQMFQVDLSENNEIVIDTDEMEAYDPSTQALMNRQVTGNYDNFKIVAGNNNLKFSGDLTKATVTNYERWL